MRVPEKFLRWSVSFTLSNLFKVMENAHSDMPETRLENATIIYSSIFKHKPGNKIC